MNMSAGDLLIGRNATTTGSHYIGGDLTVMGNYLLTGGANMNSATVTDTLAIGGYQQFTETGNNYIYFDNAQTNYLKWNDTSDQFEFANGLTFTNATATDSFYASNIFITNGGNFNAVTTTDTAYIGGQAQIIGNLTVSCAGTHSFGGTIDPTNIAAFSLTGKLTAGANEIEGSNFDIDGGDVSALTVSGGLTWSAAQNLNSQALTNVNIDSGTVDGITSLTVANDVDIGAYSLRAANLLADSLTSGRIVFASANGQLADDADLTFSTDTLTVTKIAAFTLTGQLTGNDQTISDLNVLGVNTLQDDEDNELTINDSLNISGNATTTGSHYIGGDLTVAGNYLLAGGMNMNSRTEE